MGIDADMVYPPLWALLSSVAVLAAAVLAVRWHLARTDARYFLALPYDSVDELRTDDGAVIELRRLPVSAPADTGRPPILMIHGLGFNHRNNDLTADVSLARHLAAGGQDVWLVTLRSGRRQRGARIGFAEMARHDVPLVFAEVRRRTGADQIDLLGFSMGGMLLYASLGRGIDAAHVRRVIIIGSPARIALGPPMSWLVRILPLALLPSLPLRFLGRLVAFAAHRVPPLLVRSIYNPANVSSKVAVIALASGVQGIAGSLYADFGRWTRRGGILRVDGVAVVEGLAALTQPVLFVAGATDRMAPPRSLLPAWTVWGSSVTPPVEKHFLLAARATGCHADYCHGDLAIGDQLRDDLFEPVERFLCGEAAPLGDCGGGLALLGVEAKRND